MRLWLTSAFLLAGLSLAASSAATLDRIEAPPQVWHGHVFHPNFAYPKRLTKEAYPWLAISFRHKPAEYLNAVLAYALEGQDLRHWDLSANKIRTWTHVPWLGIGPNGREYIHGLTRMRNLEPGALSSDQTQCRQTWAMAFYNDVGGAILGKIWGDGTRAPDLRYLPFLDNTVAVKLVFTEATAQDDPRLTGAPTLDVAIHASGDSKQVQCVNALTPSGAPTKRAPATLRLIQVDVAVRETRASYKTGWVFGSFRYDGTLGGNDPWRRLRPIGLMWGNDPGLTDALAATGSKPLQSIFIPSPPFKSGASELLGRGGRMNGITDDHASACSSCHMAAQWPIVATMAPSGPWTDARCWFRNVDGRYPFGFPPGQKAGCGDPTALGKMSSLDFSLELAIAVQNWSVDKTRRRNVAKTNIGTLRRLPDGTLTVDGLRSLAIK